MTVAANGGRAAPRADASRLLAIGLVAFAVRALFSYVLFPHITGPLALSVDPDMFGRLAENWVSGKGYVFFDGAAPTTGRGPGYPLLLIALHTVFGGLVPAVGITQCLLGALTCVAMYRLGQSLFGTAVGWAAALIGVVHPLLVWYSPRFRYETLLTLLLVLAILQWRRLEASWSIGRALLLGVIFGCASLINQIVLPLPLILFASALLARDGRRTMILKASLATLVAMTAVIAPWTVRNYQVSGLLIPVHGGAVTQFVKGNYEAEHYAEAPMRTPQLDRLGKVHVSRLLGYPVRYDILGADLDRALLPFAIAEIRDHPGRLIRKTLTQTLRFWYLSESPLKSWFLIAIEAPLVSLALGGVYRTLRSAPSALPLVLTVAYFNLAYAAIRVEARYSTPAVPYLIILAVAGWQTLITRPRRLRS